MNFRLLSLVACLAIASCSDADTPKPPGTAKADHSPVQVSTGLTYDAEKVPASLRSSVAENWPKVQASCPGFKKYSNQLEFMDVEYGGSPNAPRVELRFKVLDEPNVIPGVYRAHGHICQFGFAADGSKSIIMKRPCSSICLDREVDESPLERPL